VIRTLAIVRLLFGIQRFVLVFTALGVTVVIAALIFGGLRFATLGSSILVLVPAMVLPATFRQLVCNRRFMLVPQFRALAVAALLLVAFAAGGLGVLYRVQAHEGGNWSLSVAAGLLAFSVASAYLLVGQWLCTFRSGWLPQMLLMFLIVFWALSDISLPNQLLNNAWLLSLAALLGWYWLWRAVRMRAPLAGPQQRMDLSATEAYRSMDWQLRLGTPEHAGTTLMRGASDGWVNRVASVALFAVCIPAVSMLLPAMVENLAPGIRSQNPPLLPLYMLALSGTMLSLPIAQWPVRVRYIWLRSSGNRAALLRMLERHLGEEAGLVAVSTGIAAVAIRLTTDTALPLLVAYSAGFTAMTFLGAYFGMSARIRGIDGRALYFRLGIGWFLIASIILIVTQTAGIPGLCVLLAVIAALAWHYRRRARERLMRMDWCAVKPTRSVGMLRVQTAPD
jgi:hypothetical protein